ncbi:MULTISPECIES: WhiB family transcriptional regulator [unclassified Streptomyces]|uniref:WhiB family transcriptional regulator n=1 Tax=unclassified Streptomyces TaxID=2593676 RepID=UPI000DD992C6|nr:MULTISPECIES: WhiB family transcriptional regulator [unclassified Streptomyces]QZZ26570.1 WhiB family transcriptional regulator [Streptomyces sp. ST1015]
MTRTTYAATVPDTLTRPGAWKDLAVCTAEDPEVFFPGPEDRLNTEYARQICMACPVREACLEDALQAEGGRSVRSRHGVYGGLSPKQRYNLYVTRRKGAA